MSFFDVFSSEAVGESFLVRLLFWLWSEPSGSSHLTFVMDGVPPSLGGASAASPGFGEPQGGGLPPSSPVLLRCPAGSLLLESPSSSWTQDQLALVGLVPSPQPSSSALGTVAATSSQPEQPLGSGLGSSSSRSAALRRAWSWPAISGLSPVKFRLPAAPKGGGTQHGSSCVGARASPDRAELPSAVTSGDSHMAPASNGRLPLPLAQRMYPLPAGSNLSFGLLRIILLRPVVTPTLLLHKFSLLRTCMITWATLIFTGTLIAHTNHLRLTH
ncbi:putative serine/arginine-rich splicing factor SR45 isoform X1 [Iris pallida]|uniref:Serine/arginine-rich splicing factor SR45 isoform X1 n=1 Tax=Iris pallida TaxID=29817 RepID=A0AAX6ESY2_IRIPA|nr:putative serine/arginine-rich splicing factor SR45 isoform X1 [Iris pallida]